ncbi:hypothetical protein KIN20_007449 [Parelaphostrongylus tenuis]|uniref:Uncharacterized protein n=1 Tax=Parelaphostrongylus tenuis TaxID=148309 RepID=A0AAD5QHW7_PARTN|nr:hypothetical protein KIN20_007449 [Parelaphostrongylus tenuis]
MTSQLETSRTRTTAQIEVAEKKTQEYETVRALLVKERDDYRGVLHALADLQTQARTKVSENEAINARPIAESRTNKEEVERGEESEHRTGDTFSSQTDLSKKIRETE